MGTINIAWSTDPEKAEKGHDLCGKHRGVYVDVISRFDGTWRAAYNGRSVTGQLPSRDDALYALYCWMAQHVEHCEVPRRKQELHVVTAQVGGFAREDAPTATVVGVYTDPKLAKNVSVAYGMGATVNTIVVDHVPPGIADAMKALGLGKE